MVFEEQPPLLTDALFTLQAHGRNNLFFWTHPLICPQQHNARPVKKVVFIHLLLPALRDHFGAHQNRIKNYFYVVADVG